MALLKQLNLTNPYRNLIKVIVPSSIALIIMIFGIMFPIHNWDAIAYTNVVMEQTGSDAFSAHEKTYKMLSEVATKDEFALLTRGNAYIHSAFQNPEFLHAMYGAYSVKLLYVKLINSLSNTNINLYTLMKWISSVSAALCFIVLYLIGRHIGLSMLNSSMVPFFGGLIEVSRLSTPDALSTLAISILALLLLREKYNFAFIFIILIPFIRPDNLALSYLALAGIIIFSKTNKVRNSFYTLSTIVATIILQYFMINANAWSVLKSISFAINFQTRMPTSISDLSDKFTIIDYLRVFSGSLLTSGTSILILISGVLLIIRKPQKLDQLHIRNVGLIFGCYLAIHLLVFPWFEARFFTFSTVFSMMLILSRIESNKLLKQA